MQIISTNQELRLICQKLETEKILSIDTEFMRKKTYFAELCLIQIVSKNYKVIIDTLVVTDLIPIKDLLLEEQILKIFHAPDQDFDIFYNLFKKLPVNIFETQIAAEVCGYGLSPSYSKLCEQIASIRIDKTYQTEDWSRRPISKEMMTYALNDTLHLERLYDHLSRQLTENNTYDIYKQKLTKILNVERYKNQVEKAWLKVKFYHNIPSLAHKMQLIAGLREEGAREENIPRQFFATDQDLIKICSMLPTTEIELKQLLLSKRYFNMPKYRHALLDLCSGIKAKEQI